MKTKLLIVFFVFLPLASYSQSFLLFGYSEAEISDYMKSSLRSVYSFDTLQSYSDGTAVIVYSKNNNSDFKLAFSIAKNKKCDFVLTMYPISSLPSVIRDLNNTDKFIKTENLIYINKEGTCLYQILIGEEIASVKISLL